MHESGIAIKAKISTHSPLILSPVRKNQSHKSFFDRCLENFAYAERPPKLIERRHFLPSHSLFLVAKDGDRG